ncbi:MAG TPA: primosomal protein N' [Candidatus Dormibacteraeota bacterium]|nr:primosomal protein N' [Candidatus Dormibacteraeota bacterium]
MLYAEVAVEAGRALERETYTYAVPAGLDVVPGHRVWVPFGKRRSLGYVTELHTRDPEREVKEIERADPEPLLLPHQVEVARAVAEHYWAPLIDCLRAMLPPRVRGGRRSTGAGPSPRQTRHSRLLEATRPGGPPEPGPELTPEQSRALETIRGGRPVLLHGVTASGKTEVYMAAAAEVLAAGLRALVLVPEIALTPQLVERFSRRLGVSLAVLHSRLTDLERAQQWWRVRRGEVPLVIGSRSAVFAPLPRLGLICVDEEGSPAFKQDRTPRYETGWVARRLAEATGARLVLGSATPSVVAYSEARSGLLALAELPRRVRGVRAEVELVDMCEEFRRGNRRPLSRRLAELVDGALQREEQVILFLNRRGAATFFSCRDCGRSIECPGCSVSMVQHLELAGLSCHYCGYTRPLPAFCPTCGSRAIRGLGVGTQRLEGMVRRTWPAARVLRLDRDALRGPDAYQEIFETFASGRADILVGTQLVARGLDLENVTTVGVVDADLPLHFPDYRSAEMAFALVIQAAGRAGRRERPARVVVQTSNPDHYSLRRARDGDYLGFYLDEIPARQAFSFPPYAQLAVLTYSHPDQERAANVAREAAERMAAALLAEGIDGIRLQGPSPAFIHRLRGEYRWQITLRGERLERARHLAPRGRGWSCDVDPVT